MQPRSAATLPEPPRVSEPKTGEDKNRHMIKTAMIEAMTQVMQDPRIIRPFSATLARQIAKALILGLILLALIIWALSLALTNL